MQRKVVFFFLIASILVLVSCKKKEYPKEPILSFKSIAKTSMKQNGQDSTVLIFSYTDGDGDIGSDSDDNIFLRDSRNQQLLATYRFPNEVDGKEGEYRKGELQLIVYSGCCIYSDSLYAACMPNPNQIQDTMRYSIEVIDKAGNRSNILLSDKILLECN